jgi:serine/threonine-protein kinase
MDAERWRTLSPLLDALLELDSATRERSLAMMRQDDPVLGRELAALLALEDANADFLAEPLVAPPPGPRPGTLVGPYRLERMIGEGGMGQVWLAGRADGLYQRRVALKLLRPGLADPNLQLRFVRERQILARLAHPHIARLLDAGISGDGQPYLALEYVEGDPITEWCRVRNLSLDARLRLFLQTCDAVSHAHANLIVHRDLKPSNIMVTPHEEVRLLDFGIAKLLDTAELAPDHTGTGTGTGLRAFTLHYAAPEQVRGEPVTTMTDVYALGVVLHELLTGSRPYAPKRGTDAAFEEEIVAGEPTRPSHALLRAGGHVDESVRERALRRRLGRTLAGDLDNIVLKALAKRPEQRYPSVEALALDIGRYRAGKPVFARSQNVGYRMRKYAWRHRWALTATLLVAAVMSASFVLVAWQARQAVREASRAQALQDFVIGLFERSGGGGAGVPLDVRALLDAGLRRGERELAHQPVARAELTGVVARLRLGMGDYRPALALLQQQAALVATLGDDAPPSLRLESATERGRARLALGADDACIAELAPVGLLAQREQRQLPVQVADYWSQLGACRRAAGQGEKARPLFQRALALRRDTIGDAAGTVQSLADLAGLRADAGQYVQARDDYRAALRQLRGNVGARHPLAVGLLQSLCMVQRSLGDTVGAERDCNSALALSRELHGEDHPATIAARRVLASMQIEIGHYDEAELALGATRAWTAAHAGPGHPDVADDEDGLARIAWERGHADDALAHLDAALARLDGRGEAAAVSELLSHKAIVLHELGRDAEARPMLETARRIRVALFGDAHPRVGEIDTQLGQADAALGADARALAELRAGDRVARATLGPSHPAALRARLALARYQAVRGDQEALATLDALAATRAPREIGVRKVAWLAAASAAADRCSGPALARSQATFRVVLAEIRNALPEGSAVAREVASLAARCR